MEFINQTGTFSEIKVLLANKYEIDIDSQDMKKNSQRLTNQLWKLIPMRENDEDWRKQLNTVIIEIVGLKSIFCNNATFLQILSKLEGLREEEVEFELYRKTIFECISLLQELN